MKAIYLADPTTGILAGPVLLAVVPGIGVQVPDNAVELAKELAEPAEGFVWALVEGMAVLLADHRGIVYSTVTGESRPFDRLGELPEGLTALPWPGRFHVWNGEAWVLDQVAQMEAAQAVERTWRNSQIGATDFLAMPDYPLTDDQRSGLYIYRQALRDWPDVTRFPDLAGRPQPPAWIAQLLQ